MGGIGDYIHFTRMGYNKHGITRDGENDSYNFQKQRDAIKKKLKPSGMTGSKKFEKQLNHIFSPKDNSKGIYSSVQAAIEQQMLEDFNAEMGYINWETGNVLKRLSSAQSSLGKIRMGVNQNQMRVSTILTRIRALEQIRDKLPKSQKKSELEAGINNVYTILSDISNIARPTLETMKSFKGLKMINVGNLGKGNGNWEAGSSLVEEVNSLIALVSPPTAGIQKGNLFEYAAALVPAVGKSLAQTEMQKILKSSVLGDKRSHIELNGDFFSDKIALDKLKMNRWKYDLGQNAMVSHGTSQEKIDVLVDWKGKKVAMSAKNINFAKGYDIHLVSGSPLLYLVQDENPDFINHYLNIVAQHAKRSRVTLQANITEAHNAMKYTLLYKAFTGDTYGRNKASIFLVNDNSRPNGVKVYEMNDLISRASKSIDDYVVFRGLPKEESVQNRWAESGPEERIANFLSNMHQKKIFVSVKTSLLYKH